MLSWWPLSSILTQLTLTHKLYAKNKSELKTLCKLFKPEWLNVWKVSEASLVIIVQHEVSDKQISWQNGLEPLSPGAAILTIYTKASPNPNALNPNVPVGKNSVQTFQPTRKKMRVIRHFGRIKYQFSIIYTRWKPWNAGDTREMRVTL